MSSLCAYPGPRLRFREPSSHVRGTPFNTDRRETLLDSFSGRLESSISDLYIENMLAVCPFRSAGQPTQNRITPPGRHSPNVSRHPSPAPVRVSRSMR